eukprot:TRINITY_DN24015_c0_g2_i1.p1 TRINITY_DN24015_c0_g2~~TRINITY_DN24015_c0_g2_i1.p1  ORF type:complete len:327 (-),score=79.77 TRINITY_DN24015_c0_g2_i1:178-1158(-)
MQGQRVAPDRIVYNAAINAVAQEGGCREAYEIVAEMKTLALIPDVVSYNSALKSYEQRGQWTEALTAFESLHVQSCTSNRISYNTLVNVCAEADRWEAAAATLRQLKEQRLQPQVISWSSTMRSCSWLAWPRSLNLLAELRSEGVVPNAITYSTAVTAAELNEQWRCGLLLLSESRQQGLLRQASVGDGVVVQSAALAACEKCSHWDAACCLMLNMHKQAQRPTTVTMSSALSALEKGGHWISALSVVDDMSSGAVLLGKIGLHAVITACSGGGQWQWAQHILYGMFEDRVDPQMMSYSQGMAECEQQAGLQRAVRDLLSRLQGFD